MVGDHKQLPPTVLSLLASRLDYQQSLFQRLAKTGAHGERETEGETRTERDTNKTQTGRAQRGRAQSTETCTDREITERESTETCTDRESIIIHIT